MSITTSKIDCSTNNKDSSPCIIHCEDKDVALDDALKWVTHEANNLLASATNHGAVLLRDFPVKSAEDFDAIVSALNLPNFPYEKSLSNAVRVNRTPRVFSANEAPPEVQIFFHHEMAQTPLYPRWIFFSCEVAAEEGGATPICRSDLLFERLQADCPDFIQACEQRGLRYTNVMP
ncbi:MAG: TauD/TfdA family dioxygenase, partial [Planctomycetota bacterium]|nr:TauD/TfdA family dioxygenase [Planctomycetota bacterium]